MEKSHSSGPLIDIIIRTFKILQLTLLRKWSDQWRLSFVLASKHSSTLSCFSANIWVCSQHTASLWQLYSDFTLFRLLYSTETINEALLHNSLTWHFNLCSLAKQHLFGPRVTFATDTAQRFRHTKVIFGYLQPWKIQNPRWIDTRLMSRITCIFCSGSCLFFFQTLTTSSGWPT